MPTANLFTVAAAKLEPIQAPEMARELAAKFKPSVDIAVGALLGEYTADPGVYGLYDHTANDGRQVLKAINIYRVITDADGLITNATGLVASQRLTSPVYYSGYFASGDVSNPTELDDAIAAGYARLVQGTTTTGMWALGL